MECVIEDAAVKSACYREIEAVVGDEVLLWSATSNLPMTRLAAGMAHPERAVVVHPVQTQLIIFVEVVAGERTSEETVTITMRLCDDAQTTLRAFVPVFGPLQMTDLIGHDTLRDISDALYPELATDRSAPTTVQRLVRDGRLGVKSGHGFYDDNDQRVAELTHRLYQIARALDDDSP
ncbi:MAG: hypothetical protein JO168_24850 [Solirubrobacterales bacterium]|nr:hypothetical protein [Solirubrobacterales bacterium]